MKTTSTIVFAIFAGSAVYSPTIAAIQEWRPERYFELSFGVIGVGENDQPGPWSVTDVDTDLIEGYDARLTHDSDVALGVVSFLGTVMIESGPQSFTPIARTGVLLEFYIDTPMMFALEGRFDLDLPTVGAGLPMPPVPGIEPGLVRLDGPGGMLFQHTAGTFSESFIIQPGVYAFIGETYVDFNGVHSLRFDLEVPSPSGVLLAGCCGLVAIHRRRRV